MTKVWFFMWYGMFSHLLSSTIPLIGRLSEKMKVWYCKYIFEYCGDNVNIGN